MRVAQERWLMSGALVLVCVLAGGAAWLFLKAGAAAPFGAIDSPKTSRESRSTVSAGDETITFEPSRRANSPASALPSPTPAIDRASVPSVAGRGHAALDLAPAAPQVLAENQDPDFELGALGGSVAAEVPGPIADSTELTARRSIRLPERDRGGLTAQPQVAGSVSPQVQEATPEVAPTENLALPGDEAPGAAEPGLSPNAEPEPVLDAGIVPGATRADRFVAHFPIGNSSSNGATHRVGWNLSREGWAGFVEKIVIPQVDAGVRRVMLHNPFGHRPGVVMQFDQYLEAEEAGLTWLTQGFAEAWRPLIEGGVDVIAYVGSPAHDERAQVFEAAGDVAGFDVYAQRCLQPLLDAGVAIAFDSAAIEEKDTFTFRIAEWTRSQGVRTYIEPRPRAYLPHWFDYGIVTIYPFWLRTDPARFPEIADRHAANEDLSGEVIVIHNRPPEGLGWEEVSQWLPPDIQDIYLRELSPAVPFTYWHRWGGEDLESLIRPRSATAFD